MTTKTFVIPGHIKGLIFDCDGTIADTMPLHYRAYEEAMGEDAKWLSHELFYGLAGVPAEQFLEIIREKHSLTYDSAKVAEAKEKLFGEQLTHVESIELVEQVLRQQHGKMPMAVASGGTTHNVIRTLELLGLRDLFDAVVSADDVEHGKPAPDMFLKAAGMIGVPAAECLVFEDGDMGIEAAVAAGMEWVDVRTW